MQEYIPVYASLYYSILICICVYSAYVCIRACTCVYLCLLVYANIDNIEYFL